MGKSSYYVFFDKNGKVLGHSEDLYRGRQFANLEGTELGEVLDVAKAPLENNLLSKVMGCVPLWVNIPELFYDDYGFLCSFIPRGYGEIDANLDSEKLSIPIWKVSLDVLDSSLDPSESIYINDRLQGYRKSTGKFDVLISTKTSKRLMAMGKTLWNGVAFLKKTEVMVSNAKKELSRKQWLSLMDCVHDEWRKINPYYEWFWDESGECRKKWDKVPVFCEELYYNIFKRISELKGNVHE